MSESEEAGTGVPLDYGIQKRRGVCQAGQWICLFMSLGAWGYGTSLTTAGAPDFTRLDLLAFVVGPIWLAVVTLSFATGALLALPATLRPRGKVALRIGGPVMLVINMVSELRFWMPG